MRHTCKFLVFPLIAFALISGAGTTAWAQSAEEEADSSQQQGSNQKEQSKTNDKNTGVVSDSTFTPTEEISEDLSVSFPTDI